MARTRPTTANGLQGGASNFAVIISVTMKVYESMPYTEFGFSYNTTSGSDTFWSMVAYFHSQIPQLVESGLMGYFWVTPIDANERNASMTGKLYGEWLAPKLTPSRVRELLAPIEEHMKSGKWEDPVFTTSDGEEHPDYIKGFAATNDPDVAGVPVRLGSRLLNEKALSRPLPELADTLRRATDNSAGWPILGHVIAGPGTWRPKGGVAGGSNAVLPAWREACMQIALPRTWGSHNQTQKEAITTDLRSNAVQGLRNLAPDMGAYASEADPTEPNWQRTFYGENYERLLALKKNWDPHGVFWYKNGVGSELWEPKGPHGIENGVGQNPVQLCRV